MVVVGGGFTGVEGFGELLSLATALLKAYPGLSRDDLSFHLVEGSGRILPEVTPPAGAWVVRSLERRGRARPPRDVRDLGRGRPRRALRRHDESTPTSSSGPPATPRPVVASHTDLPVNERGLVVVRADLRVGTDDEPVPDAWAAGDDAAVPDLTAETPGALTVPNAQHAVRQGRLLARNLVATCGGASRRRTSTTAWAWWRRWGSARDLPVRAS